MNIPKKDFKVKVGPLQVPVAYTGEITSNDSIIGSGSFNFEPSLGPFINLSSRLKNQQDMLEQAFLHELTHAMNWTTGLGKAPKYNEEFITHSFAVILHQVINDNPKLFAPKPKRKSQSPKRKVTKKKRRK